MKYRIIRSDELYHHGIKGQKWGIKNGPPYPLDYTASKRAEYIDDWTKYYSKTYKISDKEAAKLAEERLELAKKVAITSGLILGATAAIHIYRQYGRNMVDDVIKAGTTIQTLSEYKDRMNDGEAFYTAYRDGLDKIKYEGLFGSIDNNFLNDYNSKWRIKATVDKDIKVASTKTAKKVFDELMKTNSEFSSRLEKNIGDTKIAKNLYKMMHPLASDYATFNAYDLMVGDEKVQKIFYSELSKRGYGGVHDLNDRLYSKFNTKAVILFDRNNLAKASDGSIKTIVDKMSAKERTNKWLLAQGVVNADQQLLNPMAIIPTLLMADKQILNAHENKVEKYATTKNK